MQSLSQRDCCYNSILISLLTFLHVIKEKNPEKRIELSNIFAQRLINRASMEAGGFSQHNTKNK
jgi:hypothetical protein